jgi:hypothetical protein
LRAGCCHVALPSQPSGPTRAALGLL